jgi:hypothetical protein
MGYGPYGAPCGAAPPAPAATVSIKLKDCSTPCTVLFSHPLMLLLFTADWRYATAQVLPLRAWWCSSARTCGHDQHPVLLSNPLMLLLYAAACTYATAQVPMATALTERLVVQQPQRLLPLSASS